MAHSGLGMNRAIGCCEMQMRLPCLPSILFLCLPLCSHVWPHVMIGAESLISSWIRSKEPEIGAEMSWLVCDCKPKIDCDTPEPYSGVVLIESSDMLTRTQTHPPPSTVLAQWSYGYGFKYFLYAEDSKFVGNADSCSEINLYKCLLNIHTLHLKNT